MSALKICLVTYEYPPQIGGEASYAHGLAIGLSRLGHDVVLVVPDNLPPLRGEEGDGIRRETVHVTDLPLVKVGSFILGAGKRVGRLVKEGAVDLVHITFDYPSLPLRLSGLGVPTVVTVHHLHLVEALNSLRVRGPSMAALATVGRGAFTTCMERAVISGARSVIAVSEFTRDSLAKYAGVTDARVKVIPNGIEAAPFLGSVDTGELRTRLRLGSRPVVLYVGRLEPSKGLEYLIRTFESVKKSASPCLLLVGSGSPGYSARLRRLVASLGLDTDVVFAGRLDQRDLQEAYALASAVVLPSLMEGFGITLLEAMASSKPCIGTNVGAIPEILLPKETGLLVEPANPPALGRAIQWVLANPEEAKGMGERGRERVKSSYTVDVMARRTESLYRETLQRDKALP